MKKQKNLEKSDLIAVLYTRVSTEDQAKEGFSLDAQMERLRSYCQAREWRIYKEFVDDGYSGRDTKRPAYQGLMSEMGRWDVLLVLKMDRIHRNSRNFMEMMDELRTNDKEFVSMTESLDTSTAMGRFVVDIIQRIAQLESEQIGERVYAGMKQKAKTPIENLDPEKSPYLGFNAPFGYDFFNDRLIVNENEANVVREIFKDYAEGSSLRRIATNLNSKSILTKRGKKWSIWSVQYILHNPIYAGYCRWDDLSPTLSVHTPIINPTIFNKVQKLMCRRIKNPNHKGIKPLLVSDNEEAMNV